MLRYMHNMANNFEQDIWAGSLMVPSETRNNSIKHEMASGRWTPE
jgi:hypothetical protein